MWVYYSYNCEGREWSYSNSVERITSQGSPIENWKQQTVTTAGVRSNQHGTQLSYGAINPLGRLGSSRLKGAPHNSSFLSCITRNQDYLMKPDPRGYFVVAKFLCLIVVPYHALLDKYHNKS